MKRTVPPTCSRLYSIEPIGIGTPMVESLTSYIVRLASAHCVTIGALVSLEIAPLIKKDYLLDLSATGLSSPFILQSRTVNGLGITAAEWVNALQSLTLQEQLRFTTMLPLRELIPNNKLFRKFRAWCPHCYEECYQAGEPIYDPLLWALSVTTACPKHKRILMHRCIHCNKQIPLLPRNIRPGFCPTCKLWLGITGKNFSSQDRPLDDDHLRWQTWVYDHLGTLLASAPQSFSLFRREAISNLIFTCVQKWARGDLNAFVHQFRSFNNRTMKSWMNGQTLPELSGMMDLCYQTNISMKDVLLGKIESDAFSSNIGTVRKSRSRYMSTTELELMEVALRSMLNENPPFSTNEASKRLGWHRQTINHYFPDFFSTMKEQYFTYRAQRFDKENIKSTLLAARNEIPAPSMNLVAKRLGCSRRLLRDEFPEDTRIIVERSVESRKVLADERVFIQFQALQTEFPPLPAIKCAEKLGCTSSYLSKHFHDLYCSTVVRYAAYRKESSSQRREIIWQAIVKAKAALEAERIPPTHHQIRNRLPHIKKLSNRQIDAVLNGSHSERL